MKISYLALFIITISISSLGRAQDQQCVLTGEDLIQYKKMHCNGLGLASKFLKLNLRVEKFKHENVLDRIFTLGSKYDAYVLTSVEFVGVTENNQCAIDLCTDLKLSEEKLVSAVSELNRINANGDFKHTFDNSYGDGDGSMGGSSYTIYVNGKDDMKKQVAESFGRILKQQ